MTNHAVADELYTGDFATIRDAYRVGDGNSTIRAQCENEVLSYMKVARGLTFGW